MLCIGGNMSPMDGPVQFVIMSNVACLGAATLVVVLSIMAGVVIRQIEGTRNREADLEKGVGTDGQRAQEIQHLHGSRAGR
jgi:hypothetical protein